jgi:hypothetical protein
MSKKLYVEIGQDSKEEYLLYKNFCESNQIKIKTQRYFDCEDEKLEEVFCEKFGSTDEADEKMFELHGIKYGTSYNHPHDEGSWTTAFEVVDKEVFEKTPCYEYLKKQHYGDPDVYIDEDWVQGRKYSFKQRVDAFFGDD